jgi:hypothetical protein
MPLVVADRVQEVGTANTTTSFTLSGSVTGYQSFAVIGNTNTTYYAATDGSGNWEVGVGTYSTTGPTLTRTTILSSSNSGLAVTFSDAVNIFVTYPSADAVYYQDTGGVVITEAGTADALRVTNTGTGNSFIVEDAANPDASPFVVNAGGVVIGGNLTSATYARATTGSAIISVNPRIQSVSSQASAQLGTFLFSNTTSTAKTGATFARSRGANAETRGILLSNDVIAGVDFIADDGTSFVSAATIYALVDGTPGTNDMPGRLIFATTPDGANVPTERVRIDSNGRVGVANVSPTALLNIGAGAAAASSAPLKFTSGTNQTIAEVGTVEYDGTSLYSTTNTNFKRGTVPVTNYTSGTGTALGTNTETTNAVLLPAANDTITLSSGTYFIDTSFIVTRGATSTTSATARINIRGTGTAVGSFSGMSLSAPTSGGATANFAFDAANITTNNVLTTASTTAAGVYTISLCGLLKITTSGTLIPQYSLSANINAVGTISKVLYFRLQQVDTQSAAAFGPAGTGWA